MLLLECTWHDGHQKNTGITKRWTPFVAPWHAIEYGSPHRQKTQPSNSPAAPAFSTTTAASSRPAGGRRRCKGANTSAETARATRKTVRRSSVDRLISHTIPLMRSKRDAISSSGGVATTPDHAEDRAYISLIRAWMRESS